MTRFIHFAIFFGLLACLLAIGHYYILARLSHYLSCTPGERKWLALFGGFMFTLTLVAMPLIRSLPREWSSPLAWVVYSWMGILLLMTLITIVVDISSLLTDVGTGAADVADPERRLAMQKLFGFAALGATGLLSGLSFWNALRPVAVKPMSITLAKLPPVLDGLKIVQLTDLHLGPTIDGKWMKDVVEKTNKLNPDIVAITGDLVDGSVETLGGFAAELKNLKSKYGVFFVTGNHEYYSGVDQWVAYLPTLGIRVLRNERVTLEIKGGKIDIAGIDDFSASEFPGHGPDLTKALQGRDASVPVILMAHQPKAVVESSQHQVDLQLSGHTHGGQIWPWNYLVLLQQPYIKGLHRHPGTDTQIYISDGTGYWGPPMRLGTAAEITDITLLAPV